MISDAPNLCTTAVGIKSNLGTKLNNIYVLEGRGEGGYMKKNFTEGINIMMGISRKQEYLSRVIQNARALIYKNVCAPSDITKLP